MKDRYLTVPAEGGRHRFPRKQRSRRPILAGRCGPVRSERENGAPDTAGFVAPAIVTRAGEVAKLPQHQFSSFASLFIFFRGLGIDLLHNRQTFLRSTNVIMTKPSISPWLEQAPKVGADRPAFISLHFPILSLPSKKGKRRLVKTRGRVPCWAVSQSLVLPVRFSLILIRSSSLLQRPPRMEAPTSQTSYPSGPLVDAPVASFSQWKSERLPFQGLFPLRLAPGRFMPGIQPNGCYPELGRRKFLDCRL